MQDSKFKRALKEEMENEYNSFYSDGKEHIFSPEFEEEIDRLIQGKKRHRGFFALPRRRLLLKYSLSACTALAICVGVMTVWENHIKDHISDMDNMIVPATTQTTVSIPETSEAVNEQLPVSTDPTEAATKVSQDSTEPSDKPGTTVTDVLPYPSPEPVYTALVGPPSKPQLTRVTTSYVRPYTPVSTTIIGPPRRPVVTKQPAVTKKYPTTGIVPVITGIRQTTKRPVVTTTARTTKSTYGPVTYTTAGYAEVTQTKPRITTTYKNTNEETQDSAVTFVQPTLPVTVMTESPVITKSPNLTTAATRNTRPQHKTTAANTDPCVSPTECVRPTQPAGLPPDPCVTVTKVIPVTECVVSVSESNNDVPEIDIPNVTVPSSETSDENKLPPHIVFDEVYCTFDSEEYKMRFHSYISEYDFETYGYTETYYKTFITDDGKTEVGFVQILRIYNTGKLYMTVHFLNTDRYCLYKMA